MGGILEWMRDLESDSKVFIVIFYLICILIVKVYDVVIESFFEFVKKFSE